MLIGAPHRIGFTYPNSTIPALFQTYTLSSLPHLHDVDQNLQIVSDLLERDDYSGLHFPGPENVPQLENREPYFVCHPGSSVERGMDKKRFPPTVFAQIIGKIYQEFGLKCYLAGDTSEQHIRDAIKNEIPDAILTIPGKSLMDLKATIAQSIFYLGNDSGIMHISVAQNRKCIALFGPTSETRTGPFYLNKNRSEGEHLIMRDTTLSCAPCWDFNALGKNNPCIYGDYRCTQHYHPQDEWDRIKSFVEKLMNR
jgi:ADP-heptose:LPS heptosyltransferase